jgi:phenylacetate-CoA ligase
VLYYLYSLKKSAYWDRRRLLSSQDMRLRRIVRYAYENVPFYNRLFKKFGIEPSDIRARDDLNKLPIIKKDDIRRNLDASISREFNVNSLQVRLTSGSTGQPLQVFMTNKEDEFGKAKHLRANISCGQHLMDRWVTVTSPTHSSEVTGIQQMLGFYSPMFVSVFDDTKTQISKLTRMRPDVLEGYSSSLLLLAEEIKKRGIETIKPKVIIGGAELITDLSRRFIEETFGAPFYDQYGTIEVRMSWQCPAKLGYHIDSEAVIVQFVDKNGEEVSNGEEGEVVCTSLYSYAMPFIRYAVGDICVPSNEICPCGRTLPLMKVVEGRKDSLLILPGGRLLSPRALTISFNTFRLIRNIEQFQVIQKRSDFFQILLKKKDVPVDEKSLQAELVAHLQEMLGMKRQRVTFDIEFVKDFDLDKSGKFKIVVSELKSISNQSNP